MPLMVGGVALLSLGAIGVLTGIAMLQTASDQDCVDFPCETTDDDQVVAGAVIGGIGLAALGAGIPMTVVGAQRVASEEKDQPAQPEAAPQVAIGAGSLTLLWMW